jgi:diguanylate cyclase (GGDEF)-like protein/PAS domain S-box-containing protein
MRKSLEVYRSIAEQSADSIFVTDREGRVTYQNPEARRAFGFSDEEIHGHCLHDKIHHHFPDGKIFPLAECKVHRAAVLGETARDFVWSVFRKDGSSFAASCTASPLYFEDERIGALFFATDITARKNAEDALLRSTEKLRIATDAAELGQYDYYPQTGEMIWSDRMKEYFGLPPDAQVNGGVFYRCLHPQDRARAHAAVRAAFDPKSGGRYDAEYRTIGSGSATACERWIAAKGQVFFNEEGMPVRHVGCAMDITQRKNAERFKRDASQHDSLTGLPNRSLLFEYCSHLLAMSERSGDNGAVMFIDLDRFKPINDLYGHEIGDRVLKEVAQRLLACTRKEDIVSRLGGDEFIVVLPRTASTHAAATVAKNIQAAVASPVLIDGLQLDVSPSIGISLFPEHSRDLETLIRYADLAMYSSKKGGRSSFRFYTPDLDEKASESLRLEVQLKQALENDGMALFYQPIIDIETGRLTGAEALIRLPDENGKMLSPDEFIPIAESAGLINRLGDWVAGEACKQHQKWRRAGLPPVSIAINVSPVQFRQRAFASQLAQTVKQSGIDPECLQIEVTESMVMDNLPETIATLNKIRSMGIHIALDDFGTGYSSLSYLSSLPLDKLKIDRSFISQIGCHERSQSVTEAIIALGRSLNLKVVGEGIESEQAWDYLRSHGCDQGQGYLFSKPLPAAEFESWYRAHLREYRPPQQQQRRYH